MGEGELKDPTKRPPSGINQFFSRVRRKYCSGACLKVVYLACATLVSASLIIECILANLVIKPYMSESAFESGVCFLYLTQTGRRVKCENKCSKDRSAFPCAVVQVLYLPVKTEESEIPHVITALKNRWPQAVHMLRLEEARILFLYDYISTYTAYKGDRCSTSPCNRREADNDETVEQYLRELRTRRLLPCYARPMRLELTPEQMLERSLRVNESSLLETFIQYGDGHQWPAPFLPVKVIEWLTQMQRQMQAPRSRRNADLMAAALMHRLYPGSLLFHSLFWPTLVLIVGLLLTIIAYAIDGCKVWVTDMTVIA
ncbi:hypothetical protein SprV_0301381300 [Sparganum proliferum]